MVNHRPSHDHSWLGGGIDSSAPDSTTEGIEKLRMFLRKQSFRFPITRLLFEVSLYGRAAVMPNKTSRAEADPVATVLKTPADVYIVARFPKNRIKPLNLLQCPSLERHVAAGNVLSFGVSHHDMGWAAWRNRHRCRHGGIFGRQEIVPADCHEIASQ